MSAPSSTSASHSPARASARAAAMSPEAAAIGEKLRLRRKRRGLSLKCVAERAGLSIGLLSQVERGLTMPSVRSMRGICEALDMPVPWLFAAGQGGEAGEAALIVRQSARRRLAQADAGMQHELLTPDKQPHIQMLRSVLQPGVAAPPIYETATGGICGLVLRGTLGLEVDGGHYSVAAGDSFAFDASRAARYCAEGAGECEVVWAVSPASV